MIELSEDFQGWPVYIKTLREILTELGFKTIKGRFSIKDDSEILDVYPRLLEDDGMGYGVNEEYLTEADSYIYDVKVDTLKRNITTVENNEIPEIINYQKNPVDIKVFNIFREKPTNDKYIKCLNNFLKKDKKKEKEAE